MNETPAPQGQPREDTGLLPCPFCGGEASMSQGQQGEHLNKRWFFYVECIDCGACGFGEAGNTKLQATEVWNKRV